MPYSKYGESTPYTRMAHGRDRGATFVLTLQGFRERFGQLESFELAMAQ